MMTGLSLLDPAVRSVQDQQVWAECVRDRWGVGDGAVTVYYTDFPDLL